MTPSPRGFPTQSPEARLRDLIPSRIVSHWSWDEAEAKKTNGRKQRQYSSLKTAVSEVSKLLGL